MKFMRGIKRYFIVVFAAIMAMSMISCQNTFNNVYKTDDYLYKYEAAKEYYMSGKYTQCYELLEQMLLVFKGTDRAEECMFMNAMCYYKLGDYETAGIYFEKYYRTYPKGVYSEDARFYSGMAAFYQSPDHRLVDRALLASLQAAQIDLHRHPANYPLGLLGWLPCKMQDLLRL